MVKQYFIVAMLVSAVGCTSFRTTALYRFANDSVAPQKTNKKLKGLPVKLKVPSHVQVTVYEQQVILANTAGEVKDLKDAADKAVLDYQKQGDLVENLARNLEIARRSRESAQATLQVYQQAFDAASNGSADKALAKEFMETAKSILVSAIEAEKKAELALRIEPQQRQKLAELKEIKELAVRKATVGYTLISFSPPQYAVDRQLQYTDKVFLVDFKRPAGGILNLTQASMDDEQYFAKVAAEIEERTLADISYALKTVADPISKLAKKSKDNKAIPTSSETPVAETNETVNFQKSVIATQRFDISEPDWGERLQAFVNEFIAVDKTLESSPAFQE